MKYLRLSLAVAVSLICAFVVVQSVFASYGLMPRIPYFDHLYLQDVFFFEVERGNENWFWCRLTQSNEHLMLFPMPIYWLDNELFGALGLLPVTVIQLVNLGVAAVLARVLATSLGLSRTVGLTAFAVFAATQFWGIHGVNLFWPKQVHMYCYLAAFAAGTLLYARAEARRSARLYAGALACFGVSLFSFGYGISACCGLFGVVLLRAPWKWSASLAALLALAFWFYLANMAVTPPPPVAAVEGAEWLKAFAEYVLYFLSSPVVELLDQALPHDLANDLSLRATGLAIVLGLVFVAVHLLKRREGRLATFASIWILAALTGACITAMSRAGGDPVAARADRYAMVPIGFWNALVLAGASVLPVRHRELTLLVAGALVAPLLLVSHLHFTNVFTPQVRSHLVPGEMAFVNEVVDPPALMIVHPSWTTHLPRVIAGMKQRQWSIFAGPQDEWIGRRVDEVFARSERTVFGGVRATVPVDGAPGVWRVGGSAEAGGERPEWLVLVRGDGTIAGVSHGLDLPHLQVAEMTPGWTWTVDYALPGRDPALDASSIWIGYARTEDPKALRAWFVFGDGTAAPLQQ
jgi:hypothetical protein